MGPAERTLWLSCGLGCDRGWGGGSSCSGQRLPRGLAPGATLCHLGTGWLTDSPNPAQPAYWMGTLRPREEKQLLQSHTASTRQDQERPRGPVTPLPAPPHRFPSRGGGRQSDGCSLEGTLNVPFTRPWTENPQPLQRGRTQVSLYIFCSFVV